MSRKKLKSFVLNLFVVASLVLEHLLPITLFAHFRDHVVGSLGHAVLTKIVSKITFWYVLSILIVFHSWVFLVSILRFSMIVFMIKLYLIANPIGREVVSGGFRKINLKTSVLLKEQSSWVKYFSCSLTCGTIHQGRRHIYDPGCQRHRYKRTPE